MNDGQKQNQSIEALAACLLKGCEDVEIKVIKEMLSRCVRANQFIGMSETELASVKDLWHKLNRPSDA